MSKPKRLRVAAGVFAGCLLLGGLVTLVAMLPSTRPPQNGVSGADTTFFRSTINDIPADQNRVDDATKEPSPSSSLSVQVDAQLEETLKQVVDDAGKGICIAYVPLSGSNTTLPSTQNSPIGAAAFGIDGTTTVPSASMIKLIVLSEVLREVAQDVHALDEQLVIAPGDIVGGSGVLQSMGAGTVLSLRDAASYMIEQSDNVATNMLIDLVGMDAVNAQAKQLGLDQTELQRYMLDESAASQGRDNYTSARDVATLLCMIAQGNFVNPSMSALALDFLKQQRDTAGIAEGVPSEVEVAHKTGTLSGVEHDGAIVMAEKPYVLVVMTQGIENGRAKTLMSSLSKLVYDRNQESIESINDE